MEDAPLTAGLPGSSVEEMRSDRALLTLLGLTLAMAIGCCLAADLESAEPGAVPSGRDSGAAAGVGPAQAATLINPHQLPERSTLCNAPAPPRLGITADPQQAVRPASVAHADRGGDSLFLSSCALLC
jgi:hypothetical protein